MAGINFDKFDLLKVLGLETNEHFQITFDWYTPRPHFIIVPKEEYRSHWRSIGDLDEDNRRQLVSAAVTMVRGSGLAVDTAHRPVLSVHTGPWLSNRNNLHVHICVDLEKYLNIFNETKCHISDWPKVRCENRDEPHDKDHYPQHVCAHVYPSYHANWQKKIKEAREGIPPELISAAERNLDDMQLVFHRRKPIIGFLPLTSDHDDIIRQMATLERFARTLGLTDTSNRKSSFGCHLCFAILGDFRGEFPENPRVKSYIRVASETYYVICSSQRMGETWNEKFISSQSEDICRT